MKVKCFLCDKVETLENESPLAKKLRNRPIHTYMCQECDKRIGERTIERFTDKEYKIYHRKVQKKDNW
ncbi:MAG TPA: YlaI family protein [Bacillales bacterium]|nr:YlaI family protein [Bacillales bacterium]